MRIAVTLMDKDEVVADDDARTLRWAHSVTRHGEDQADTRHGASCCVRSVIGR